MDGHRVRPLHVLVLGIQGGCAVAGHRQCWCIRAPSPIACLQQILGSRLPGSARLRPAKSAHTGGPPRISTSGKASFSRG